jgi:hypothetical protein
MFPALRLPSHTRKEELSAIQCGVPDLGTGRKLAEKAVHNVVPNCFQLETVEKIFTEG